MPTGLSDDSDYGLFILWALGWGSDVKPSVPSPDALWSMLCCLWCIWRLYRSSRGGVSLLPSHVPILSALVVGFALLFVWSIGVLLCERYGSAIIRWVHVPLNFFRVWTLETLSHGLALLFLERAVTASAARRAFSQAAIGSCSYASILTAVMIADVATRPDGDCGPEARLAVASVHGCVCIVYALLFLLLRVGRAAVRPYALFTALWRAATCVGLVFSVVKPGGSTFPVWIFEVCLMSVLALGFPLALRQCLMADAAYWRGMTAETASSHTRARSLPKTLGLLGGLRRGRDHDSSASARVSLSELWSSVRASAASARLQVVEIVTGATAPSSRQGYGLRGWTGELDTAGSASSGSAPNNAKASGGRGGSSRPTERTGLLAASPQAGRAQGSPQAPSPVGIGISSTSASTANDDEQDDSTDTEGTDNDSEDGTAPQPDAPTSTVSTIAPRDRSKASSTAGGRASRMTARLRASLSAVRFPSALPTDAVASALARSLRDWAEHREPLPDEALPGLMAILESCTAAGFLLDYQSLVSHQPVYRGTEAIVLYGTYNGDLPDTTHSASVATSQQQQAEVQVAVKVPCPIRMDAAAMDRICSEAAVNVSLARAAESFRTLLNEGEATGADAEVDADSVSLGSTQQATHDHHVLHGLLQPWVGQYSQPMLTEHARQASMAGCRNLVQFLGACVCPPDVALLFRWCEGGTLRDWLDGVVRATQAMDAASGRQSSGDDDGEESDQNEDSSPEDVADDLTARNRTRGARKAKRQPAAQFKLVRYTLPPDVWPGSATGTVDTNTINGATGTRHTRVSSIVTEGAVVTDGATAATVGRPQREGSQGTLRRGPAQAIGREASRGRVVGRGLGRDPSLGLMDVDLEPLGSSGQDEYEGLVEDRDGYAGTTDDQSGQLFTVESWTEGQHHGQGHVEGTRTHTERVRSVTQPLVLQPEEEEVLAYEAQELQDAVEEGLVSLVTAPVKPSPATRYTAASPPAGRSLPLAIAARCLPPGPARLASTLWIAGCEPEDVQRFPWDAVSTWDVADMRGFGQCWQCTALPGTSCPHVAAEGRRGAGATHAAAHSQWIQRLAFAVDAARALAFLHGCMPRPLLHRDIKSLNLLLTRAKGSGPAKGTMQRSSRKNSAGGRSSVNNIDGLDDDDDDDDDGSGRSLAWRAVLSDFGEARALPRKSHHSHNHRQRQYPQVTASRAAVSDKNSGLGRSKPATGPTGRPPRPPVAASYAPGRPRDDRYALNPLSEADAAQTDSRATADTVVLMNGGGVAGHAATMAAVTGTSMEPRAAGDPGDNDGRDSDSSSDDFVGPEDEAPEMLLDKLHADDTTAAATMDATDAPSSPGVPAAIAAREATGAFSSLRTGLRTAFGGRTLQQGGGVDQYSSIPSSPQPQLQPQPQQGGRLANGATERTGFLAVLGWPSQTFGGSSGRSASRPAPPARSGSVLQAAGRGPRAQAQGGQSQLHQHMTGNIGTTAWMAPEVLRVHEEAAGIGLESGASDADIDDGVRSDGGRAGREGRPGSVTVQPAFDRGTSTLRTRSSRATMGGLGPTARYGPPADVYSMGLVLWELATGGSPHAVGGVPAADQDAARPTGQASDFAKATALTRAISELHARPSLPPCMPKCYRYLLACAWHPLQECRPPAALIACALQRMLDEALRS